jgi:hypothetical protein
MKKEYVLFQNCKGGIQLQLRVTVKKGKKFIGRLYVIDEDEREHFIGYTKKKYDVGEEIDLEKDLPVKYFFNLSERIYYDVR